MLFPPNGKTLKEKIVHALSQQWPLTAKKLYNIMKKDSNVSYQAVHKALRELSNENIIKKEQKLYSLDHNWIDSSHEIFERMKYGIQNSTTDENKQILFFDSRNGVIRHLSVITSHANRGDILFGHNKSNLDYPQSFYEELGKAIKRNVTINFIIPKTIDMERFGKFLLGHNSKNVILKTHNKDHLIRLFGIAGKEVMVALPYEQSLNGIYVKDPALTNYIYMSFLNYWNSSKLW